MYPRGSALTLLGATLAALLLGPIGSAPPAAAMASPSERTAAVPSGPQPAFYTFQAPNDQATAGKRVIALTFDDGPGPYTPQVLSVLQHYGVPATFFEIGIDVAQYPQYTRMVAAAGDPVEDHTWSHPDLTTIPTADFSVQIDRTQSEIESLTGVAPTCLRPPYDAWNASVLSQIAQRGLTTMSYSIDPRDWSQPGTAAIVNAVVGAAFPGAVVDLHDAGGPRGETVAALPQIITDLRALGYTFVSICGSPPSQYSEVYSFGQASQPGPASLSRQPWVGIAASPSVNGYWLAAANGSVVTAGGAEAYGSLTGVTLSRPIVGMAASSDGRGYWLVASDGGVFSFGDARFQGSTGGVHLVKPIVGMAPDPSTGGYWLVASDGGVFSFDAPFYGSLGGVDLNAPVVGMAATSDGRGYWLVASDGGVFSFGDARFEGSTGGVHLAQPVVGISADPHTAGYWLVARDGGVFNFGAPFLGSRSGRDASDVFYSMSTTGDGAGYLLAGQRPG